MMIPKSKILSTIFYDIETTTRYKTFDEYKESEPFMADEFIYRCQISDKYKGLTPDFVYTEYGMLYPEHGQVVSIAYKLGVPEGGFGGEVFGFKDWADYESRDKRFADKDILIQFNELLFSAFGENGGILGGYRINYFDNPFLFKRMIINGIYPQQTLNTVGKAKWEMKNIELYDWWNALGVNGMCGFGGACEIVGVKNPKEDGLSGRNVCHRFWDDNDVVAINEYCMRDVDSSIHFAIALSEEKLKSRHQKTMADYNERMGQNNTNIEEGQDNG